MPKDNKFKNAAEYEEPTIDDAEDALESTEENVDPETENSFKLKSNPKGIKDLKDEEAVKWQDQIRNFENAKVGAKSALEKIKAKYPEDWYKRESNNGEIRIFVNGIPVKWEPTYVKANPKPKPTEEKHGTQFVMKFPKGKKDENETQNSSS